MKKIRKTIVVLLISLILVLEKKSYAALIEFSEKKESFIKLQNFSMMQFICVGIGVFLILLILFISYKTDKSNEEEEELEKEENTTIKEEESLYESFEKLDKDNDFNLVNDSTENIIENEIATENFATTDSVPNNMEDVNMKFEELQNDLPNFKLDEIFDEKISNIDFEEKETIEEITTQDISTENFEDKIDTFTLDEDFLMQMNKNIEENQKVKEKTAKKTTRKTATKKAEKEEKEEKSAKKITRKTATKKAEKEEKEEKPTKKATRKTATKKAKKEEVVEEKPTKKGTRKIATKKAEKEEKEEKTTKKATRKTTIKK